VNRITITFIDAETIAAEEATSFPFMSLGTTGGRGEIRGQVVTLFHLGDIEGAKGKLSELVEQSIVELEEEEEPLPFGDPVHLIAGVIRDLWPSIRFEMNP
jgi:hypothetical protein